MRRAFTLLFLLVAGCFVGGQQAFVGPGVTPVPIGAFVSTGATPVPPCDIAAQAGTPCIAAHSVTRRMWSGYTGALFQLQRASDSAIQNIGFLPNNTVNQAAINTFCSGTSCGYSILYDQMHTAASGNNLPAPGTGNQSPVTYTTFSNGAKLPMVATVPGQFLRNRAATVGIPVGNSSITEYMVQNTFTWSQCCGTYGEMENTVHDDGQGTMFALTLSNNLGSSHPGIGNGPWPGIDWEDGIFSTNSPTITSVLLSTFGRYNAGGNAYSLKSDAGLTGTLTLWNSAAPPATPAFEGGISLGEGGDGTPAPTAFFEGIIIAGATSDATDNALNINVAAFYNGIGSTPQQPAQIQTTSIAPGTFFGGAITLSPTTNVPAGSLIVMFAGDDTPSPPTDTLTDTQGNTYTQAAYQCSGFANANPCPSGFNIATWFVYSAKALSTSDTITFTPGAGSTFSLLGGFYAPGILASSNPLDVVNTSFTTSGNAIVSATPNSAADFFVVLTNSGTGANPDGWNVPIPGLNSTVGTAATIRNPGTGQLTYTSPNAGSNRASIIVGFKHQ